MKTTNSNKNKRHRRPGRKRSWTPGVKPNPVKVVVDGEAQYIGIVAAAKWLGCAPSSLSSLLRSETQAETLKVRAMREFPQLFENENENEKQK